MAFFVDGPLPLPTRSKGDDPALDFNIENVAEDVINGLFCTYEPPTSTKSQRRGVKDAMDHPQKYSIRSRLKAKKSILKYAKINNSKQQQQQPPNKNSSSSSSRKSKKNKNKKMNKMKNINKNYHKNYHKNYDNGDGGDGDGDDGETIATTSTELAMYDNNKSVTWRDQQSLKQQQQQKLSHYSSAADTKLENNVVEVADKYCGIFSGGGGGNNNTNQDQDTIGIADVLSSPTIGRVAQSFCFFGDVHQTNNHQQQQQQHQQPRSRTSPSSTNNRGGNGNGNGNGNGTPISMASMASGTTTNNNTVDDDDDSDDEGSRSSTNKKVLYDDLGNPIEEDDIDINNDNDGFFSAASSSTPRGATLRGGSGSRTPDGTAAAAGGGGGRNRNDCSSSAATAAAAAAAAGCSSMRGGSSTAKGCRTDLICSNFAFMDNVMAAVGVAAVAAGVPPSCYNTTCTRERCTGDRTGADEAAYDPKGCKPHLFCTGCSSTGCYDDNNNNYYNNNLHHHPPSAAEADTSSDNPDIASELNEAQQALGIYEPKSYGPQPGRSPSKGGGIKFKRQPTPKHMRRSMQDLDDKLDAKEENKQQKKKNNKNNNVSSDTYSASRSDVDSEITMGNTTVKHFGRNRSYGDNSIIQGEDYASLFDEENNDDNKREQRQHTPKKSSFKGSFSTMFEELKHVQKERSSLSSPYSGIDNNGNIFERKNSTNINVGSIKKQLEKSNKKKSSVVTESYLKSINTEANSAVTESRVDDGTLLNSCRSSGVVASLKKQFETRDPPSGGGSSFFNRSGIQPPTPRRNSTRSQYHQAYHQAFSPRTFASDDEIREEVSKDHLVPKDPPVMRHCTLEVVPRTVAENDDNDIYLDQYEEHEERQDRAAANAKKKGKNKRGGKSKKSTSLFKSKSKDKDKSAQRPATPMKKLSKSLKKSMSRFKKGVQSVEGSRIGLQQDERDDTINVKRMKPPAEVYYEA
jgi:hypothetical protein